MARAKKEKKIELKTYDHKGETRKNIPPVGLVSSATDKLDGRTKYAHDPHIDPFLSWAGKKEGTEFDVQNVSLHIHERIDPKRIVKSFLKKETGARQISLFEKPDNEPPLNKAIDFYRHEQDWTNRLIAGDSLLVMNSLLNKEGMGGKVQMIYIDPPYGIKYNSNFQPFVNKKDVRERDEDIPAEPEMIQAFRDTWELGIHSYLNHLRDRLLLARELLHESGSIFVQISDENVHLVRSVVSEVFGENNFVNQIGFRTAMTKPTNLLNNIFDYIIWYSKDKKKLKFHPLFYKRENINGYKVQDLVASTPQAKYEFTYNGISYNPRNGWRVSKESLERLAKAGRIHVSDKALGYLRPYSDFPYVQDDNIWNKQMSENKKIYVVQTFTEVIQRCLLMTTNEGELVFDPTCGSGTTAYVSEQWGRRWITCDTSRVSINLAKQRLMTAKYSYYKLAHKDEGVKSGFGYTTVPHITLETIANGLPPKEETLYDQPLIEKDKVRVTGPFTVEAVPCLRVKPFDGKELKIEGTGRELAQTGETGNQTLYREELKATGIRTTGGKIISFSIVEPMMATRFLHAKGEILENNQTKKAYISFGPDFGPLEQRQIEEAIKEARIMKEKPDFVIFAAFHFDPEAAKDIDQIEWPGVQVLKAQMSVDLLTADLRKKRSSSQSYWLIGQPDVDVVKLKDGNYKVVINGFDYYNPVSGEIESKSNAHIAMWFLDTDYDERSLLPDQVFFPMKDSSRDWTKLAKVLNGEVDEELLEVFTGVESLPFKSGDEKKIAVKIIDNRGIESFVIKNLD